MYVYNATSERRIVFNISNFIFGEKPSGDIAINLILFNTKQFIFRCLKQSKLPTFHGLIVLTFKIQIQGKTEVLWDVRNSKVQKQDKLRRYWYQH